MEVKKIDKRCKFMLGIDTETCGSLGAPLVYDLGVTVFDQQGRIYEQYSWIIYDIFVGEMEKMKTAYYAEKIPQYRKDLDEGKRKMVRFQTAFFIVRKLIKNYNIKGVPAYNTAFDVRALNNTLKHTTGGKYRYFFPVGIQFIDIWNMACSTLLQRKSYFELAEKMGWESEAGNVRTNAEVAYSYLTKKHDFAESHTALEDVFIEMQIYLKCKEIGCKPEDMEIIGNPWRKPQPSWKEFRAKKRMGERG